MSAQLDLTRPAPTAGRTRASIAECAEGDCRTCPDLPICSVGWLVCGIQPVPAAPALDVEGDLAEEAQDPLNNRRTRPASIDAEVALVDEARQVADPSRIG